VSIQLAHLVERLADRRIELVVSDEAKVKLAELGWDPAFGARPLKRVIQRELGDALALAILEGSITDGSRVEVSPSDSGFAFTTTG
jgi:ATP-dependent Clp protease ATP-binding subunit ClpB